MSNQSDFDKFHAASHGVTVANLKTFTHVLIGIAFRILRKTRPTNTTRRKGFDWAKDQAENK